jgi:hypothetical protein
MPGIEQSDWRGFDAAADDRFHFAMDTSAASAGILTEGDASLPADRLIEAMAQLAEDAYDQSSKDAVADGWHALSAAELGIQAKGSGSVRHTFEDGVYVGDTNRSSEGQALVLTREVDGKTVLTVAFRGTVDLEEQFLDYFPFDNHYKGFKPLVGAVKKYVADASNGIDKVVVTGHSLGAAMAQLFMNETLDAPLSGYTFGSPGADGARHRAPLLNFEHTNDAIPDLGDIKDERSGGVVTVDINGLDGSSRSHSIERYMKTTAFLSEQAEDKDGPFHGHKLAKAFRDGGTYIRDIRLEIGSDANDRLRPFAEDRFSLAGDGDDRFGIRRDELVPKRQRDFDGGDGDDRVLLPHNRIRKDDGVIFQVAERNDGGMALKYDAAKGAKDKWKTVGVFYRTETIVYDNGKTETLGDTTTKIAAADNGDLIVL